MYGDLAPTVRLWFHGSFRLKSSRFFTLALAMSWVILQQNDVCRAGLHRRETNVEQRGRISDQAHHFLERRSVPSTPSQAKISSAAVTESILSSKIVGPLLLNPGLSRPSAGRIISRPIIDSSLDSRCAAPKSCVFDSHVPLLCREDTISSDQNACNSGSRCCELTGGNNEGRIRSSGPRKRQADGHCPNNSQFFCSPVTNAPTICQRDLGELDCGADLVCCEVVALSESPAIGTSGHIRETPATNAQWRPLRKCPTSTGAHSCIHEDSSVLCDETLGRRDCPVGQICCYSEALGELVEPAALSNSDIRPEPSSTCVAPQTCVERLSSELICDGNEPTSDGGCGNDKLCCTLISGIPTGFDAGSPNNAVARESEVDKEVRRCLEVSGTPNDDFQRLLESRPAIGLSADLHFGEPTVKKCFHVGGECMPAGQAEQCSRRSKPGEPRVFDKAYFCAPPNSVCCRRLGESETVESFAQRASEITKSNFACSGKERFTAVGSWLPHCWLVEIYDSSRHFRIAVGALVKLDVVSTSGSALGALNPETDALHVRVGLNRKQHHVKMVVMTDSDGAGNPDKKRDLAFLFLEKPAKVDEASACTICLATFDYNPECFDGAEMECQVLDHFPVGGWKSLPLKSLGGSASECSSSLDFTIAPHQWCLTRSMTGFCPHRAGAPVVCNMKDGEPRLFGHWSEPTGKKCTPSSALVNLLTNSFSRSALFKDDKPVENPVCGVLDLETRIFNGATSAISLWPWLVTIIYRPHSGFPKVVCGGSLISPNVVLTAAHCFDYSADPGRYLLVSGNSESLPRDQSVDPFVQTRNATVIKIHPRFDRRHFYANDIALVAVKNGFEIGPPKDRTALICLPSESKLGDQPFQSTGLVAGWGDTESNVQSTTLREATLTVLKDRECRDELTRRRVFNFEGVFCAKSDPLVNSAFQTVCSGDSGSPFTIDDGGKVTIQGIVSLQLNEKQCSHQEGVQTPVIFTKVSAYIPWIKEMRNVLQSELN